MAIQDFSDCECTYGNQFCEDEIDCKGCDSALTLNAKGKDPRQVVPNYLSDYVDSNEEPIIQNSWKQWKNIEQGKPISICQESSYLCGSDQTGYYRRITAKGQNDLAKYLYYINSPFEMEAEPDFSQIDEVEKGDLITADSFNNLAEPLKTNIIGNMSQLNLLKYTMRGQFYDDISEIDFNSIRENEREYLPDSATEEQLKTFEKQLDTFEERIIAATPFIQAMSRHGYEKHLIFTTTGSISTTKLAIFSNWVELGFQEAGDDGLTIVNENLDIIPNDQYPEIYPGLYREIEFMSGTKEDFLKRVDTTNLWNTWDNEWDIKTRFSKGVYYGTDWGHSFAYIYRFDYGHLMASNYNFTENLIQAALNDPENDILYHQDSTDSTSLNLVEFLTKYTFSESGSQYAFSTYPQISQQTPIKAEFYQWLANTASKVNTFPVDACKNCNEECQFCDGKTKQTST